MSRLGSRCWLGAGRIPRAVRTPGLPRTLGANKKCCHRAACARVPLEDPGQSRLPRTLGKPSEERDQRDHTALSEPPPPPEASTCTSKAPPAPVPPPTESCLALLGEPRPWGSQQASAKSENHGFTVLRVKNWAQWVLLRQVLPCVLLSAGVGAAPPHTDVRGEEGLLVLLLETQQHQKTTQTPVTQHLENMTARGREAPRKPRPRAPPVSRGCGLTWPAG